MQGSYLPDSSAAMHQPTIAGISPLTDYLQQLHARYADLNTGTVASYIPALAHAEPNWFGICLVTADGYVYEVGDTRQPFTIQSISKILTYGIALEDNGVAAVLEKISVEPSGDGFNSISLKPGTGKPYNPMINAGGITASGMVRGSTIQDKVSRILTVFSSYAGRDLSVDAAVYHSESATGFRNRAIGWMLRSAGIIEDDPTTALETYFQQCSITVDCRVLATMAAVLANGGVNPLTGQRCLATEYVPQVLTIMGTCGMYNYAGEWLYTVGLPAKSGVSGGLLAVLPGRLGIAVFSPPLDELGHSVRGIAVCRELSTDLNLHLFESTPMTAPVRMVYSAASVPSQQPRTPDEQQCLYEHARRIVMHEVQGTLTFAETDVLLRQVRHALTIVDYVVLDMKRVLAVNVVSARLIADFVTRVHSTTNRRIAFSSADHLPKLIRTVTADATANSTPDSIGTHPTEVEPARFFADSKQAIAAFESRIIAARLVSSPPSHESTGFPPGFVAELAQHLDAADTTDLERILARRHYKPGASILDDETPAHALLLLVQGVVALSATPVGDTDQPLRTLVPGSVFTPVTPPHQRNQRTAYIALTEATCLVLDSAQLRDISTDDGNTTRVKLTLLTNLLLLLTRKLQQADDAIQTLAQ